MTKIALTPNPSGTGTFTLETPASNSNRSITLPDAAGTLLTSADFATQAEAEAGTDNTKLMTPLRTKEAVDSQFNVTGNAPKYACRAWVNFDGTTSPGTIRASGNVSSVTKNGTGDYTVNFTTAMPDANYACVTSGANQGSGTTEGLPINIFSYAAGSVRVYVKTVGLGFTDSSRMNIAILR
jgi:hypothetical protein